MENGNQEWHGLTFSAECGELVKALAAAKKNFKAIKKESVNPYYKSKYSDLSVLIEATQDPLADQGLVIVQSPRLEGEFVVVTTLMMHTSNQWMRDELAMLMAKADAHGEGSAITYARRYAYQSFLSIAAEEDDDANAASGKEARQAAIPRPPKPESVIRNAPNTPLVAEKKTVPMKPQYQPAKKPGTWRNDFWAEARRNGRGDEQVREFIGSLGYESTHDVPDKLRDQCMDWASQIPLPEMEMAQ